MGFKHTEVISEQAYNWEWMINKIKMQNRPIKVLNICIYRRCISSMLICRCISLPCRNGFKRNGIARQKKIFISSGLQDKSIRYIVDDVQKFLEKRNKTRK